MTCPGRELHVVTGGAGFIGSHLVRSLLEAGHRVRVADDFSSGHRSRVPAGVEVIEGDVTARAGRAVEGASVVYHLAAMVSVPRSVEDPRASHRATAESTLAVLDAAERAGVRRVVYASSSAVYGDAPGLPRREDQAPRPLSPYAVAKLAGEHYACYWAEQRRLETVTLRFFNVYGPGQDPDSPYAAAIPIFFRLLLAGRRVTVYGDGLQTRDFTYVGDVVRGIRAAGRGRGVPGGVYNLAAGRGVTILELLEQIGRHLGVQPGIAFVPPRPGDIRDSWADVTSARRDLGFEASTPLDEGLRQTLAGFRSPGAYGISANVWAPGSEDPGAEGSATNPSVSTL